MQPLSSKTHKTLLPILDETTILDRILNSLRTNNILDVVIVTGYQSKELQNYAIKRHHDLRFEFIQNDRYSETNNIYSLALAFEQTELDQDILVIESDLIFHSSVITQLVKSPSKNVALVDHFRFGMDGTAVVVENGKITQVIPPHLQNETFDFSDKFKTLNIYKFDQEFCESVFKRLLTFYARTLDDNCYYELILGILIYMQSGEIEAEMVQTDEWAEVDDPNDLDTAAFIFNKADRRKMLDQRFGGYWNYNILDFAFIRNMHFPTGSMLSAFRQNLPALLQNYGSKQSILNEKLSYCVLYKSDRLQVLNGASQIFPILGKLFIGTKTLIPDPTFGEFYRCFYCTDKYDDRVGIDVTELESKISFVDTIVIVNPNNPTGTCLPTENILSVVSKYPDKNFIIDESFIDFASHESIIPQIEATNLDNVVVIKSLSKSLGVPGLRLGYAYSSNLEWLDFVGKELPIWNMNSLAEYFLETLLKYRKEYEQSIEHSILDRNDLTKKLADCCVIDKIYPSEANFVLVKLTSDIVATDLADAMAESHNIYLKNVSDRFHDGQYLRIAVRTPSDHDELSKALQEPLQ